MSKPALRVALAGNPNAGKTSLFNALTGSRQNVGNYPGVTVEKRVGSYQRGGRRVEVIDLPGTYSLTSYSPEERIAQDELLAGGIDVVVAVVDATTLRRSLVFFAQLLQLGINPVLCLNMADEARAAGQSLDVRHLSEVLGFPVVETIGHRRQGIDLLAEVIDSAAAAPVRARTKPLAGSLAAPLGRIEVALERAGLSDSETGWVATKLLVGDEAFEDSVRGRGPKGEAALAVAGAERAQLEAAENADAALLVMSQYQVFVDELLEGALIESARPDARSVSDRVDRVLVHRVLGLPSFLAVMFGIFWLTFTLGEAPMGWIESGFAALGGWIDGFWPAGSDSPLRSLLVDGVIGGVGGVLVFLPNVVLLFLGLAFLEDSGYMARAAFLMDRLMHRFGLHGRSFLPMMTGFGCSIPGIMATRTLENERDRLITILVLPLMSCGARLTIWLLLIPAFFPAQWQAPMLWLIYVIGVLLAFGLAWLLRKSVFRGEDTPFVMELPPYRLPTWRAVVGKMRERAGLYLRKAGTVILAISIVMWAITAYPKKDDHAVDADIAAGRIVVVSADEISAEARGPGPERVTPQEVERRRASEDLDHSIAGRVGSALEVGLSPLGFDQRISVGLIAAFAAKEVFVSQMSITYSLGEGEEGHLRDSMRRDYAPLVGFCLMLFLLIATPCMATVAITRRETGSWKWALLQMGGLTTVAYVLTLIVYQIGRLFY